MKRVFLIVFCCIPAMAQGMESIWADFEDIVLFRAAAALQLLVSTSGDGKFIVREGLNESQTYGPPTPVTEVIPSATGSLPPGSTTIAGVEISRGSTFFALTAQGEILQLDFGILPSARTLSTGQNLKAGVASPGNTFLYVLSTSAQSSATFSPSLRIVNLTTFQPDGSIPLPTTAIPSALAITPDGKYLFVAGALAAQTFTDPSGVECHLIDLTIRSMVKTFRFLGSLPRPEIVMSPDGDRVFLTIREGVAVIDVLTQTVSHTIGEPNFATLGGPAHIAINPRGTELYMSPLFPSGVATYDLASSTRTRFLPLASLNTMTMAVTADGQYLVIDHIVPDPATGRNDFPSLEFVRLADGKLVLTKPWTGPRDVPLTVHQLVPVPAPVP
jgi:DNA-binding beta-propeller fold protein YncE